MFGNPQITPSHFLLGEAQKQSHFLLGEAQKQINCEAADPDAVRWQFLLRVIFDRFNVALRCPVIPPEADIGTAGI
jgi:hypothetical protein